jgi:hypothetical protein
MLMPSVVFLSVYYVNVVMMDVKAPYFTPFFKFRKKFYIDV